MEKQPIRYAMSTDQGGFLGQSNRIFREVTPTEGPKAVEVLGFGPVPRLKTFINNLREEGYSISEIHGRTGNHEHDGLIDVLLLRCIEPMMIPTETLVAAFPDEEILIHAPEGQKTSVQEALAMHPPKFVWIENHGSGEKGIEDAANVVAILKNKGVPSVVMCDVYHFFRKDGTNAVASVLRDWQRFIEYMNDAKARGVPIEGFHVPIGTRVSDSLPLDMLTDTHLIALQNVIASFPTRVVVFENQPEGITGLLGDGLLNPSRNRSRTSGILARFRSVGLVPTAA